MIKKEIKLHELKYYHDTRHGFVFTCKETPSENSIQDMVEMLKRIGVTDSLPEFYTLHENSFIFVYPEICEFLSGPFYQAYNQICGKLAFLIGEQPFEIDILNHWLSVKH